MLKHVVMLLTFIVLIVFQDCALAQLELPLDPLFPTHTYIATNLKVEFETKGTVCYTTSGPSVTECRRKRGIDEKPYVLTPFEEPQHVAPSQVLSVETTRAPRNWRNPNFRQQFDSETITSSKDDVYDNSYKLFRQLSDLSVIRAAGAVAISIRPGCAGSSINFSKFLSCIGLNVQPTQTVPVEFTTTQTVTVGSKTLMMAGCIPPLFRYPLCLPSSSGSASGSSSGSASGSSSGSASASSSGSASASSRSFDRTIAF